MRRQTQTVHPFRSFMYSFSTQQDRVLPVLEHSMYEHNIGCMFDANSISGRSHVHRFNMYLMPAGWL